MDKDVLKVLLVILAVIIVITVIVMIVRDGMLGNPEETTTKELFKEFQIVDMPQIHTFHATKHAEIFGSEVSSGFRSYNPSLVKDVEMLYVYRISNYTNCVRPADDLEKVHVEGSGTSDSIASYIAVSVSEDRIVDLVLPKVSEKGCTRGFEDPRPIISHDGTQLLIAANVRSRKNCSSEMWLIRIPIQTLREKLDVDGTLQSINANDVVPLHIYDREGVLIENNRTEKNWMPFYHNDELHFVYSINPHIILKCDESGKCTEVSHTYNKTLPKTLRGGSQIKLFPIDGNPRYIGITHTRQTKYSYVTQFYAFDPSTFHVTHLSPNFIFDKDRKVSPSSVQFVAGFEIVDDLAYVTYGEDDCYSMMFKTPMRDVLKSMKEVDMSEIESKAKIQEILDTQVNE